ncbi:DUF948 domain-containing protein [Aquipuribacter nitratireducens]|uniref:DUF948 domain-containing protein n=1 Tax=Aquipuribacter nitratireducens TaxID=650104 RepID=A0ABW0GSI9_9MICO
MTVDLGDVAGLIAAIAFLALVMFIAVPLVKLGSAIDEARITVRNLSNETTPLISEVTTTVATTNEQLVKVDTITTNVASTTTNVSALTALFAATLGSPIIRVAAFTYGVRQALSGARSGRRAGRRMR